MKSSTPYESCKYGVMEQKISVCHYLCDIGFLQILGACYPSHCWAGDDLLVPCYEIPEWCIAGLHRCSCKLCTLGLVHIVLCTAESE